MEPRFSASISGDAPLTFAEAKASPYVPLVAWLDRLSTTARAAGLPPSLPFVASEPQHRSALRLRLAHSIKNNATLDPLWEQVYPTLFPHVGSLLGHLETGVEGCREGAWIHALFEDRQAGTGLTALSTDFARVTLVRSALNDPTIAPSAWLKQMLTSSAVSGWGTDQAGHWMLSLLDTWQSQGLTSELGPPARVETLRRVQECVQALDQMLAQAYPFEPLLWRHAARQVEARLAFMRGTPEILPKIPEFPIHIPNLAYWDARKTQGAAWRTGVGLILDWTSQGLAKILKDASLNKNGNKASQMSASRQVKMVDPNDALFKALSMEDEARRQWFDCLTQEVSKAPEDHMKMIRVECERFKVFLVSKGLKSFAAQMDRMLLDARTAPATALQRKHHRL